MFDFWEEEIILPCGKNHAEQRFSSVWLTEFIQQNDSLKKTKGFCRWNENAEKKIKYMEKRAGEKTTKVI